MVLTLSILQNEAMSIDDFDLLKVIGKGSFGKVRRLASYE